MEYYSPEKIEDAYALLAKYGEDAVPIAGSSFFMGHREELFDEVQAVVDIKRLGLNYIKADDVGLRIGATTTLHEIERADVCQSGAFEI
ncbi:MAG: FAD binding domain-containing protein, partial [Gammaproteobacteria bacterium]|nr:FAD binding domain-containing protein [Gammaproteobacteria bacterium]